MGFMKPVSFGELAASDIFYDEPRKGFGNDKCEVWMKVTGNDSFNAVSDDGTRTATFDDARTVEIVRKKIHILDLRQGDQVSMVDRLGLAYTMNTVLKVEDKDGSRYITFARPMICADGFGTTGPTAKTYVEKYTTSVRINDTKRNDYYHLHGVDTSAIYDDYRSTINNSDRHRMATFMKMLGDTREMAEILCQDGLTISSQCTGLFYGFIKQRELMPEYPDRDDSAEGKYVDELREKTNLSKWEKKYLGIVDASRAKLG